MATDAANIELSPAQKQALADLAAQSGRPWHEVFDSALRQYSASKPTAAATVYDALAAGGHRLL
jgi:predicted transcriptional regulator